MKAARFRSLSAVVACCALVVIHAGLASLPHTDEERGVRWVHGSCAEAKLHGATTHMHQPGEQAHPHTCLACLVAAANVATPATFVVPGASACGAVPAAVSWNVPDCPWQAVLPFLRAPPSLA